jgi:hypothetical protein
VWLILGRLRGLECQRITNSINRRIKGRHNAKNDMKIFKEITDDHGTPARVAASNNRAEYILTSAHAKDMRDAYLRKWNRLPSSSWYRRNFRFEDITR